MATGVREDGWGGQSGRHGLQWGSSLDGKIGGGSNHEGVKVNFFFILSDKPEILGEM